MTRAVPMMLVLLLCACSEQGPPTVGVPAAFDHACDKANEGKRIRLEGYLDFPAELKASELTVMMRLRPSSEPGGPVVGVSVSMGSGANQFELPPKTYTAKDLKLHTSDGKTAGYRDKVKASGTMYYPSSLAKVEFKCGLTNTLIESAGQ